MYKPGSRAQRSICGNPRNEFFGRRSPPRGFPGRPGSRFGGRLGDARRPSRFGPPLDRRPFPPSRGQLRRPGWGNENRFNWNDNGRGWDGDNNNNRRGPPPGIRWGSPADRLTNMLSQRNIFGGQQGFSGPPGGGFSGPRRPDVAPPIIDLGGQFGSHGGQFGSQAVQFGSQGAQFSSQDGQFGIGSQRGQLGLGSQGGQLDLGSQAGQLGSPGEELGLGSQGQLGLGSQGGQIGLGPRGGQFGAQSPDFTGTMSRFGGPAQDFQGSSVGGSMFSPAQSMGLDVSQAGFAGTEPMLFEGQSSAATRTSIPGSSVKKQPSSSPSEQQQFGMAAKATIPGAPGPGSIGSQLPHRSGTLGSQLPHGAQNPGTLESQAPQRVPGLETLLSQPPHGAPGPGAVGSQPHGSPHANPGSQG